MKVSDAKSSSMLSSCLVNGTKMKHEIIKGYQATFGAYYQQPITTKNLHLGTSNFHLQPPTQCQLVKQCKMRPASNKYYNIIDLSFKHVVVLVLNDYLNPKERSSLSMTSKAFNKVVVEFPRLMKVDWRPLLLPRLNYQSQSK